MEWTDFHALTDRLAGLLAAEPTVLGIAAVGSAATGPDRWSDHDLFVVVADGTAEPLRQRRDWIPDGDRIVLVQRETEHALRVLWSDAHLAEIAIFEEQEFGRARCDGRYRVLLDRGTMATAMARIAGRSGAAGGASSAVWEGVASEAGDGAASAPSRAAWWTSDAAARHADEVLLQSVVALGRWGRGERLSARAFLQRALSDHLVPLLRAGLEPRADDDPFDPRRRFERADPVRGEILERLARLAVPQAVGGLLALYATLPEPLVGPRRAALAAVGALVATVPADAAG